MKFGIKAARSNFFDRAAVINAVDKATLKVLKEFGRLVRKTAQASLRYSDKTSRPGAPPHAHKTGTIERKSKSTGKTRVRSVSYLREFLYFVYDKSSRSVVIGPAKLNGTVSSDAPSALEYGGPSVVVDRGKRRRIQIRARPFMGPAYEAEKPKLSGLWKDSIG